MYVTKLSSLSGLSSKYHQQNQTAFRKSAQPVEQVPKEDIFNISEKRDTAIIDYLEKAQKRDEQNQKMSLFGVLLSLAMFPVLFYF